MREGTLLTAILLKATQLGNRLFRNNIGTYQDKRGNWIKYGVQNPGGSDLIGWTSVTVTHGMIGKKVAIFTAVEGKTQTVRTTKEQELFLSAVREAGGIAIVARDEMDYIDALRARVR